MGPCTVLSNKALKLTRHCYHPVGAGASQLSASVGQTRKRNGLGLERFVVQRSAMNDVSLAGHDESRTPDED